MLNLSPPSPKSLVSPGWVRQQMREVGLTQSTEIAFESFEQFCGLLTLRLKTPTPNGTYTKLFRYEEWHAEQKRFQVERTGRDVVCKPRQVGFGTLELARDLFFAITKPGTNVLIVTHESQLADQMFGTIRWFARD